MTRHLGPNPFETYSDGHLRGMHRCGMICVYPSLDLVVTGAGTHGDCHQRLVDSARELGLDPSLASTWLKEYIPAVARKGHILIRDDGHPMEMVFHAAQMLERLFPNQKEAIRYLGINSERVRDAVRRHGELWRINPAAQTTDDMLSFIRASKVNIGTETVYYYNPHTGTRYLTDGHLQSLSLLPPWRHNACTEEINLYMGRVNKRGYPELVAFNVKGPLMGSYLEMLRQAENKIDPSVGEEFTPAWICALYRSLSDINEAEEEFLGLSPELKMKIEWLPGALVADGPRFHPLANDRVRGIIKNILDIRRDGEYINIGSVIETRSMRHDSAGRREVYVVELGVGDRTEVFVVRMQDWDTWQYLEGASKIPEISLKDAEAFADEYARFKFLSGDLAKNLGVHKQDSMPQRVKEIYRGRNSRYENAVIAAQYSIRRFVYGIATDKVPLSLLRNPDFASRMATLLGEAAASNMIVGRANPNQEVLFNDGDEYFILENGMPAELRVGDVTGALSDYQRSFAEMKPAYEERLANLFQLGPEMRRQFADALVRRYQEIRNLYLDDPRSFTKYMSIQIADNINPRMLSLHDEPGSFIDRARNILKRLEHTTPEELEETWRS